jgi:hypothetical protein
LDRGKSEDWLMWKITTDINGQLLNITTDINGQLLNKLYRGSQFYWWSTRRKPPTCRKSLTNFIT